MAEQISRIRLLTYSPEKTFNSLTTITADSGTAYSFVDANDLTDATLNKYEGAMWYCVLDAAGGDNTGFYRRCDGFDPTTGPTAELTADAVYFQGDLWAADVASSDTFNYRFVPRIQEASLERNDVFCERSDYHRDTFDKFPDVYVRTEADVSFACELTGMGMMATYDTVQASPAPTTETFSVADGADFAVGQSIWIDNSTDGLSRRYISSISTNAITVTPAMSNAPTANDKVYGLSRPGEVGNLIAACIGTVVNGGGSGSIATAGTSGSSFTIQDKTQFAAGQYIGVEDADTLGTVEWTQLLTVDASTGVSTCSPALSFTPAANDKIYNTFTVQPADTGHETLTFQLFEDAVLHTVNGGGGTFSIDGIETDECPKINFSFVCGGNETLSDSAINSNYEDIYCNTNPPVPIGAYLQIAPSTAVSDSEEFRNASFELGSQMTRRYSPYASAGIAAVSMSDWDSPTITCQINMDSLSSFNPMTAFEAGTLQRLRLILGGTPGRTVIIDFRQAQTKVVQGFNENDGREYWEVTFEAKNDASSTLPPFVIALG